MKYMKTLVTIIIMALLLISCNQEQPKENPPDTTPPPKEEPMGPVAGGELTIGTSIANLQNDPLGYQKAVSPIYNITPMLYRGLLAYDENLKLTKDIASSFEINKEEKTILLKLKDGLKFSDGASITVNDVKFSYELYSRSNYNGKWKDYTFNIEGTSDYRRGREAEVLGIVINEDNSITIQYSSLDNVDLQLLLAPILSKEQLKDKTMEQIKEIASNGELLATGMFKLVKHSGDEWVLEKNENYPDNIYLDQITFKDYADNKNVDLLFALPQHVKTTDMNEEIKLIHGTGYQYLGMNLNDPVFKDKATREAIASALDYQKIIQDAFNGYADKPLSVIHPNSWLYQPMNEQVEVGKADILKDKQLTLDLAFSDIPMNQSISQGIKDQLKKYGVTVNLKPIAPSEYVSELFYRGDHDLFLASWPYEYDPLNENYKWLSSKDVLEGGYNVSHVQDATSDELLKNGIQVLEDEERKAIYQEWQDYFMGQHFIIPLASPKTMLLPNENLTIEIKNSMLPYQQVDQWWIKQEKSE